LVLYFTNTPTHTERETTMNVSHAIHTAPTTAASFARFAKPAGNASAPPAGRHQHRERDFGVGYGNSSGYAAARQYASNWAPPRFKFA